MGLYCKYLETLRQPRRESEPGAKPNELPAYRLIESSMTCFPKVRREVLSSTKSTPVSSLG